ncbi:MAG TPA: prepilin-type N-terminal cleavage/methylation domain-containing protein [Candidatus Binatia bacterium]
MLLKSKIQNRSFGKPRIGPERSRTGPKSKIDGGFTLIEVTIAITLLALIVLMLYGSFYLGERAMAKAQERSDQSQSLRSFEEFLAAYIHSAHPYRPTTRDPAVYFIGDDRSVEFVSSLSTGLGGRGMAKIRIAADSAGSSGATLTLDEEMPVRMSDKGLGSGGGGYRNSIVLAAGLRSFRIEYLDPQSENENWVDEWDGRQRRALPRAVRLSFHGDRRNEVRWVFPIMIGVLGASS